MDEKRTGLPSLAFPPVIMHTMKEFIYSWGGGYFLHLLLGDI